MTLSAASITIARTHTVTHDTSPAILAAVNAAISAGGGTVYIPPVSGFQTVYPINSTLVLPASGGNYVRLLFNGVVTLFQSVVIGSLYTIEGLPGSGGFNNTASFANATSCLFRSFAPPSVCR